MSVLQHIKHLAADIGPRGSCTKEERAAASYCQNILAELGYEAHLQPFRALTTFSWLHTCFFWWPFMSWLMASPWLSLLGTVLFFLDLNTIPVLSRLFPAGHSQNVIARNPVGQGTKIVLVAHLDSSKAGLNFSPALVKGFRTSFLLMAWSFIASPILLGVGHWQGGTWRIIALVPALYLAFASLTLIHREFWNKYTPGANDNASGVAAVLEAAARLKDYAGAELTVLLTGAEEAGTYGAARFIEQYGKSYRDAYFINLDNIGQGRLHYMRGEGMFPVFRATPALLAACDRVAARRSDLGVTPGVYTLLSTDAMPALVRGYQAISFLALSPEGLLPNWHWPTDTVDNVDMALVETAAEFVVELVHEMCASRRETAL
ncbi:MAG: hypothetical protein DDT38_01511 [Firmicutes bacterium]|nr:hypothetical protein [candidate division NPL-UPA2 bacterium]